MKLGSIFGLALFGLVLVGSMSAGTLPSGWSCNTSGCGTLGADGDVPSTPGGHDYFYVSSYGGAWGAGGLSGVSPGPWGPVQP